jgi:UDP-N-acetylmuramoyl-L-alanyl-D-glutamate--2,6-diaminopimelate ligase
LSVFIREIIDSLQISAFHGDPDTEVLGVTHDSRKVEPGWIFAAIPGDQADGHSFIPKALEAGASAILAQRPYQEDLPVRAWIQVPNSRKSLAVVADLVFGRPTEKMTLVGITGTNGKTSLTFLLESILMAAGHKPGIIGTVNYRWNQKEAPASHTTPEATDLQAIFKEMAKDGVTHVVMEVSSHGLFLNRLDKCQFDVGVFTNLSQDHLDFHPTLEQYYQAKRILFSKLLVESKKPQKSRVLNLDDIYGRRLAGDESPVPFIGYGTSNDCEVRVVDVGLTAEGIAGRAVTPRGELSFESRLVGDFNLQNILAAIAVSEALGLEHQDVIKGLKSMESIPGRLERVESTVGTVLVDYAHTPEALRTALKALNSFRNGWSGRIITVMGCGGDRDRTKRPIMGKESAAWSDLLVITSDNPRSEDPSSIIDQILEGLKAQGLEALNPGDHERNTRIGSRAQAAPEIVVIKDRREAIHWAVKAMDPGDILLIAGKGHETYQEIKGVRYPFDDRVVAREALAEREASGNGRSNQCLNPGDPKEGAAHES